MKFTHSLLSIAVAALATGCANPLTDGANDAAGTGDAYLAREVVAVHLLTTDYHYDKMCNYLEEGFVQGTFNIDPLEEMNVVDDQGGCRYLWKDGSVTVSFGSPKPYQSIYHSEYAFDRKYQPLAFDETPDSINAPTIFGPSPQGTASSVPAIQSPTFVNDSLAIIDTINGTSQVTTKLTEAAYPTKQLTVMPYIGDKSLWDADKRTLHTLYLNHIVDVTVTTKVKPELAQKRAAMLTQVILDKIGQADRRDGVRETD